MKIMNKILSKSNSYNYYKSNFEKFKKENKQLKHNNQEKERTIKENKKQLNEKNQEIKNKDKEITRLNNDFKKLKKEKEQTIKKLKNQLNEKNQEIKNKDKEITRLYYYAPKAIGRKWLYEKRMGRELDLNSPKDFNEKINWLIVNKYGEEEGKLTDKILVKDYIKSKNVKDLFIPKTYKIYKDANEINIQELPEKFVLKCNHGSGLVFVCLDKETFDLNKAKTELNKSLKENYALKGLEYHYEYIEPYIMAEEYLNDEKHIMPIDYKFYSFNGKVENILVCSNRENRLKLDDFDLEWNLQNHTLSEWKSENKIEKPKNLEKMIKIAEELGKDFLFVRVDLYEINDKIYFGELTFTPGNATINYYNQETLDFLGEKLILPLDSQD